MNRSLTVWMVAALVSVKVVAQISNIQETRSNIHATSLGPAAWEHQVKNMSDRTIIAFHGIFRCPKDENHPVAAHDFRFDSLIFSGRNMPNQPIAPGQTHSFLIPPQVADCPGRIDAVIFTDGHSEGSQDEINDIYKMRLGAYEALTYAEKLVDTVITSGADPNTVADDLMSRSQVVSQNMSIREVERSIQTDLLTRIAHDLNGDDELHVPPPLTYQRQQETDAVMKTNQVSRQQARAILLNRKLHEKIKDLDGHTQPPP
jgi:hypothetical protein